MASFASAFVRLDPYAYAHTTRRWLSVTPPRFASALAIHSARVFSYSACESAPLRPAARTMGSTIAASIGDAGVHAATRRRKRRDDARTISMSPASAADSTTMLVAVKRYETFWLASIACSYASAA